LQTPDDIKAKKTAKKEKKAAKQAAKAAANGHGHGHTHTKKNKKGGNSPLPGTATPVQPAQNVDSAPQPTGSEATPAGSVVQRQPQRATVEEVEDE
jgi:translocation protein SEC62